MKSTFTYGANYQIIGKCEPQKLSYAGAFKPTEGTLSDLADHIRAGHPWMPAILDEGAKRWQQHANRAEVLALDIDGGMTIEEAIAHPFIAAHCGLAIETASSTPALNKFRLVFRLAEPIQNWQTVRICNQYLLESVNVADKACKDASRFFFGAPGRSPFLQNEGVTLPIDFVDQALAWHSEQERIQDEAYRLAEANRAKYSSNDPKDTYELVKQALSFIPGRSPGSGNYDECVSVLMALFNEFGESDAIALAESWSPSIKGVWDIPRKVRSFARGSSRLKTIGSLFHIAKGYGFKFPERDEWQQRDRESKSVVVPQTMSLDERDRFYRDWLAKGSLNERDRADLERRGVTDFSIALSCEFGYAVPFKGLDGTYLGAQWRYADPGDGGRYRWHNLPGGKYYPGTNELPIAVYLPSGEPKGIALVEGTGIKPMLAAERLGIVAIGAAGGLHAASPIQMKAIIEAFPGLPIVIIPDAGDVINPHVMARHKRTAHQFPKAKFLWYEQVTKQENDVDEASAAELESARSLSWGEFEAIAPSGKGFGIKETEQRDPSLGEPDRELYEAHQARTEAEQENEATAQRERERARKEAYKAETDRIQKALNSLTHPIAQELNQRYLSGIKAPQKGEILAISSACNTGKTTQLKGFVTDWRSQHPDGLILMIGGRNALLMQTGLKTGIPHIQELDRWYHNNLRVALQQEKAVALCIDSLHRINLDWLPENTLIILDEGEATLQQALEGGTLGSRQNEALEHFRAVLNRVMERNGSILLMEDALTDLSLNLLNEATYDRYALRLVVNRHQSESWDVTIGAGSPSGFLARHRELQEAGCKVLLTCDSQIHAEATDSLFAEGFKTVRVDAQTVEDPAIAAFRPDPNAHIEANQPDLLILTPTVQSGADITHEHFDINLHYASHLEARLQNQMPNRYRVPVPREIYCAPFAPSEGGDRGLRPAQILKDWSIKARSTLMRSQVETFIKDGLETWDDAEPTKKRLEAIENWKKAEADSPALFWARHAANFKARQNGSKCQLLKSLTETLESKGHRVTDNGGWEKDITELKLLSGAKETIRRGRAADRANADITGLDVEKARRILNSNDSLYADRCKAHKVLLMDELPGVNLTPEFVLEAVINHNGALKRATTLLFLTEHPEIATYLDRQSFKGQLDKPFVATWRLSHKRSVVEVLLLTGIKAVMNLDEYQESDEAIIALKAEALKNRLDIKRYLGLNINEDQTGIGIAGKLLKKLSYRQVELRREGARGKQTRIWQAVPLNQAVSDDIIKALETKWVEHISAGSHAFNKEESTYKKVATDSQIPADWFSNDSLESIRAMWEGCKSDEIRLYMETHIPIAALKAAIAA